MSKTMGLSVNAVAWVFTLLLSTLPPYASVAQEANHRVLGSLFGQVRDASGAAIANASLRLIDRSGTAVSATRTNEAGSYLFASVPIGKYTLKVSVAGFKTFQESVEIQSNAPSCQQCHAATEQTSRKDVVLETGSVTVTSVSEPVYNALLSPTTKGENSHLIDGQLTTLKFFIGPHDAKSALELPLWTVNPRFWNKSKTFH